MIVAKCFPNTPHVENVALTALVTVVDIITDILGEMLAGIAKLKADCSLLQSCRFRSSSSTEQG